MIFYLLEMFIYPIFDILFMKRTKRMKKRGKLDTRVLIIAAVLILAAVFLVFSGGLPSIPSITTTTTIRRTTTTAAPATTTTALETTTTTAIAGDTCNALCMAADYSQGTCRPACLSYETRGDTVGSDCTDIQRCCCK